MEAGEDGVTTPLLAFYDDTTSVMRDGEFRLLIFLKLKFFSTE